MGYETPSPTSSMPPGGGQLTNNLQKKHSTVMKKMFPGGVDESRREVDYARQAFDEDKDQNHVAHPRNQHQHQHGHGHGHLGAKQSTAERHDSTILAANTNGQTPERVQHQDVDNNGDVAMEDAEQTEDEGRSIREQTGHSAPYPDSASHEEPAPRVQQQQQQQQQEKMSTAWSGACPAENPSSTLAPGLKAEHAMESTPTSTTEVKTQEPDSS
jgi:hypothetical protein